MKSKRKILTIGIIVCILFSLFSTVGYSNESDTIIILYENDVHCEVDGEYRVYDINVFNRVTGEYEPLNMEQTYTFSGIDYFLLSHAGGMSMFENANVLMNDGLLDVKIVEKHITENLNGVIGEEYSQVDRRITFTDGKTNSGNLGLHIAISRRMHGILQLPSMFLKIPL